MRITKREVVFEGKYLQVVRKEFNTDLRALIVNPCVIIVSGSMSSRLPEHRGKKDRAACLVKSDAPSLPERARRNAPGNS